MFRSTAKLYSGLINHDLYERLALAQEEQMKERAEWRKKIVRK